MALQTVEMHICLILRGIAKGQCAETTRSPLYSFSRTLRKAFNSYTLTGLAALLVHPPALSQITKSRLSLSPPFVDLASGLS